jgi:hypothetical protein
LTTGVEGTGKLLAKYSKSIDPERDSSSDLYITKTLKFDGSKVKGHYIFLTVKFDTGKVFLDDRDFTKSDKTYSFGGRLNMGCDRDIE